MYSPNGVLRRQHYDILHSFRKLPLRAVYGYYWLQEPQGPAANPRQRGLLLEEAVYLDFGRARGLVVSAHPSYAAIAVGQLTHAQVRQWGKGVHPEWHMVSEGVGMQDTWRRLVGRPLSGHQTVREFGRDVGLFLEFGQPSVLLSGFRGQLGVEAYAF